MRLSGRGRMRELTVPMALSRLGSVPLGRIAFTTKAMPAIRPVNHVVEDGEIIIRTHSGAALTAAFDQVVAYEADQFDQNGVGWSVVVTGIARAVTDAETIDRYEQLLRPWVDQPMDLLVRLRPEIVTGYELGPDSDADGHCGDAQWGDW